MQQQQRKTVDQMVNEQLNLLTFKNQKYNMDNIDRPKDRSKKAPKNPKFHRNGRPRSSTTLVHRFVQNDWNSRVPDTLKKRKSTHSSYSDDDIGGIDSQRKLLMEPQRSRHSSSDSAKERPIRRGKTHDQRVSLFSHLSNYQRLAPLNCYNFKFSKYVLTFSYFNRAAVRMSLSHRSY